MYVRLVSVLFFLLSALLHASEIRGKVVSVVGGEPLARVQVTVLETAAQTVTASDGSFAIRNLVSGSYTLRLNVVGYRLVTVPFSLAVGEQSKEFEVTLVPDNFRRTETVEVKGDVFNGSESPAINQINLTSSEVRETSTVLANDPLRSVQSMPGVSAAGNNDFDARISVSGAPFEDVSIYLDGILVPAPFHGAGDFGAGTTLSILTSDAIEGLKLFPAAYPEKYGDAVGAALALDTRDGSRAPATFRASVGLADADILGEGQLGRGRRGSWLASRKSYLGYLLRNRLHNTFTDVSFYDADLKLTYDLTPNQAVSFYGVGGHTLADLVHPKAPLKSNEFKRGTNEFVMARVGWRWTINPRLLLDTRAAFLESPFTVRNVFLQNLRDEHYNEAVIGSTVVWSWRQNHILEGGWSSGALSAASAQRFMTTMTPYSRLAQARLVVGTTTHSYSKPQVFWVIGSTLVAECGSIAPITSTFILWRRSYQPPCESPMQLRYNSEPDDILSSSFPFSHPSSISREANSVFQHRSS